MTVSQLLYYLKEKIKRTNKSFEGTYAMFLFVNDHSLPILSKTLREIYYEFPMADGYLHLTYSSENCYG